MHTVAFTKMNGAGNDFVVFDNRAGQLALDPAAVARLCDRQRGVGADGVLAVEPAAPDGPAADCRMRYYNADGGEAEMCGNGARCFARFASRLGAGGERISFQTQAGVIHAHLEGERVRLDMSRPTDGADLNGLALPGGPEFARAYFVNTGVPHAVMLVDDAEAADVFTWGQAIRRHARFAPRGTNANFVQRLSPEEIILRTYERGVEGETLACGTGAVAAALAHAELNNVPGAGRVAVRVRSGGVLYVGYERTGAWRFESVTLAGPADFVFHGQIAL